MLFSDPLLGFHFSVAFELFSQPLNDFRFQEVTGLTVDLETEDIVEGGENRFVHKLPKRTKYSDITLKRGMFIGSEILLWCNRAIEDYDIQPSNVLISLLDEMHLPVASWYVVNAYPTQLSVSEFKSDQSQVVVESIKLNYNYFKNIQI
jgi:phage tail-like protein